MRFSKYIKEDKIVKKALGLREPSVGDKFPEREKDDSIILLNQAIDMVNKDLDSASDEKKDLLYAQLADLEDKLNKWEGSTDPPERTIGGEEDEDEEEDEGEEGEEDE